MFFLTREIAPDSHNDCSGVVVFIPKICLSFPENACLLESGLDRAGPPGGVSLYGQAERV